MTYRPRRAPARFLEGAPVELIAVYDDGPATFDRYTAIYDDIAADARDTWIGYRGMSEHPTAPTGFGIYEQFREYDLRRFRCRSYRKYIAFAALPPDVRKTIERDCRDIRKEHIEAGEILKGEQK